MDPNAPPHARARRSRLLFLLPLLGVALGSLVAFGALRGAPAFHGTAWDPPEEAADFLLVDHDGNPARLSDHRGKTVLLFFGFVDCPDVCPLTLTRLGRALDSLGADTSEVRVLLVTVDPERDTPAALAAYVAPFAPHVLGLTGDSAALAAVRRSYHAHASPMEAAAAPGAPDPHAGHGAPPPPANTPTYSHTTQVFGIDREGRIRVLISPEFAEETIRADIRTLMRL